MPRIDCSKTVNFLWELGRMCKNCDYDYGGCALSAKSNGTGYYCMDFVKKNPERAVEVVQAWSDEHPQKTRLDDLKEKYPKFEIHPNGYPCLRPFMFGYCKDCGSCTLSPTSVCWDEPLEAGATGKAVE